MTKRDRSTARNTPCPITAAGYLAHAIDDDELVTAGGAEAFFAAWMDREARTKVYQRTEFLWRRGELFDRRGDDPEPDTTGTRLTLSPVRVDLNQTVEVG